MSMLTWRARRRDVSSLLLVLGLSAGLYVHTLSTARNDAAVVAAKQNSVPSSAMRGTSSKSKAMARPSAAKKEASLVRFHVAVLVIGQVREGLEQAVLDTQGLLTEPLAQSKGSDVRRSP